LLRYSRSHNVNAWFLNMVFGDEHKILIKKIYQLKGYNARQLRTEFPDKGWTSSINRLLKKFRDTGTVDRRQGSDRPRSGRTDENIDQVNDMVLNQEDQPRTHSIQSVKYYGRHLLYASHERICSWNALRGDVCKSWLRRTYYCTARKLLLKKFFSSLPRTLSSVQMKRCSLWLQQWKNCENQLRFHWVNANKIKRVLRAQCIVHQIWTSNFPDSSVASCGGKDIWIM